MADNSQLSGTSNPPFGGRVTSTVNPAPGDIDYQGQGVSPAIIPSRPVSLLPLVGVDATMSNPNSRGVNDVSDIRPTSSVVNLPIRGEKRLVPQKVNASELNTNFSTGLGQLLDSSAKVTVRDSDFFTYANTEAKRLQNAVDFIKIRIPHRGVNSSSLLPDPTKDVEYRFLVNPNTLTVNRQTVDSQSLTRGGWQFGVWGEDTFLVQMQGTSAGSYFSLGLTDEFSYYAVSYRNLMQLQEVFENNGYWFEGEEYNERPLAADYLRRRIRMHQDVELWAGNFIWSGMFDSFTLSQDATQPFMLNFSLSFFVWKEQYRQGSPYPGSIANNVQRGHSYQAVEGTTNNSQTNNTLAQYSPASVDAQSTQVANSSSSVVNANSNSPAIQAASAEDALQTVSSIVSSQLGTQPLKNLILPGAPVNKSFWNASNSKPIQGFSGFGGGTFGGGGAGGNW